jgi:predicted anti-sigma-YlaC factor YlaD
MTSVAIMNCRQVTELVTDHLERRLSPVNAFRVSAHLWWCRSCRAYVAQMKTTLAVLKELPREGAPAAVRDELRARFSRARGRH